MGLLCSSKTTKKQPIPKLQHPPLQRALTTKSLPQGEIYYIKTQRTSVGVNDQVTGGKLMVQLSFSLKVIGGSKDLSFVQVGVWVATVSKEVEFVGMTEELEENSLSFHSMYKVDFFFERSQALRFEIFYMNKPIDSITTVLGKIMGSRGNTAEFPIPKLSQDNITSALVVQGKAVDEDKKNLMVTINLQYDLYTGETSEKFIMIRSEAQRVYKSTEKRGKCLEFLVKDLNVNDLTKGDDKKFIEFQLYDAGIGIINSFMASLDAISSGANFLNLNNNAGQPLGTCKISINLEGRLNFADYLNNGLQISIIYGIDYTSSNLHPKDPNSRHYCNGPEPNHYEQALRACGSIVEHYDYDQYYPVLGFGGKLPGSSIVSHCFHCNLKDDPNVYGLEEVIATYKKSLENIVLDGPTYFHFLIEGMNSVVRLSLQSSASSVYYILLILTDGQIHDTDAAINAICEAAKLPISIIIIGIGDEDFSTMKELDGDKVPLCDTQGIKVERDIVQFVKFNDFKADTSKLAEEVLCEVPEQVESYYRKNRNFMGNKST